MKPTRKIASFIAETTCGDIPDGVSEIGKRLITDGVAVALGGFSEIGEKVGAILKTLGGTGKSTMLGSGFRTNAPMAAFANGTMSHVLDYDDISVTMGGHPTGPVLAAALATGELAGANGAEVMLAYLLGVEVECKIGGVFKRSLYGSAWHPTAILGVFGAAVASSKLLNLNANEITTALGVAASLASGIKRNFGTMTKSLHVGQAAKNGVMAALLAKDGWDANDEILTGKFGLFDAFGVVENETSTNVVARLGDPWEMIDPGVSMKKFPCCGSTHSAIDAMLAIMGENQLEGGDVKKVVCDVHPEKTHVLVHPRPQTPLEAKFSLEFCLAVAAIQGRVDLRTFTPTTLRETVIQDFLPLVSTRKKTTLPKWGSEVVVETFDGSIFTEKRDAFPSIEDGNELKSKFMDCANPVLGNDQAGDVFDMISGLDDLSSVSTLMKSLVSPTISGE